MLSATTQSDMMVGILDSRSVVEKVAVRCTLTSHYRIRDNSREEANRKLRELTNVTVGDEGIVEVTVEAKTPELAARIANLYVDELDGFLRTSNVSRGKNMRQFVGVRLEELKNELAVAEDSLRVFQSRHGFLSVDDEMRAAVSVYAELRSRLYLLQTELDLQAAVSPASNPRTMVLSREVQAIRSQLRKLETAEPEGGFGVGFAGPLAETPLIAMEFLRRYREFRVLQSAFEMLHEQHEYAKVLEARDAPTLSVLDEAVPPERRSFPRRTVIVLAVTLFSLVSGAAFVFLHEYFLHLRVARPEEFNSWQGLLAPLARFSERFFRPNRPG